MNDYESLVFFDRRAVFKEYRNSILKGVQECRSDASLRSSDGCFFERS